MLFIEVDFSLRCPRLNPAIFTANDPLEAESAHSAVSCLRVPTDSFSVKSHTTKGHLSSQWHCMGGRQGKILSNSTVGGCSGGGRPPGAAGVPVEVVMTMPGLEAGPLVR